MTALFLPVVFQARMGRPSTEVANVLPGHGIQASGGRGDYLAMYFQMLQTRVLRGTVAGCVSAGIVMSFSPCEAKPVPADLMALAERGAEAGIRTVFPDLIVDQASDVAAAADLTLYLRDSLARTRYFALVSREQMHSRMMLVDRPTQGLPTVTQAAQIGRNYSARVVISGALQRQDDVVRLSLQAVDARTGSRIFEDSCRIDRQEWVDKLVADMLKNLYTNLKAPLERGTLAAHGAWQPVKRGGDLDGSVVRFYGRRESVISAVDADLRLSRPFRMAMRDYPTLQGRMDRYEAAIGGMAAGRLGWGIGSILSFGGMAASLAMLTQYDTRNIAPFVLLPTLVMFCVSTVCWFSVNPGEAENQFDSLIADYNQLRGWYGP
jgi:TolB-like protein